MSFSPQHIAAQTVHRRKGANPRQFSYGVDYVLCDPDSDARPSLFSRNRFNLLSLHDSDHGGRRHLGEGLRWATRIFAENGLENVQILLLTQPRFLWFRFNPVSFWFALDQNQLVGAIAEVNNTFGDRHSYLCLNDQGGPLLPQQTVTARKMMHVSPYQRIDGEYAFNFNVKQDFLAIKINLDMPGGGLFASLNGRRTPLNNRRILAMLVRRPFGALRTVMLIYWQALKLKLRGETYLSRPAPPEKEIS